MALTMRQERFAAIYAATGNATRARREAGYKELGTPERNGAAACKLLKKAEVATAVEKARQRHCRKLDLTLERVVAEIYAIGFSNIALCFDQDGRMLRPAEMPLFMQMALSEWQEREYVDKDGNRTIHRKVKLHPKWPPLEKLSKLAGVERLMGVEDLGKRAAAAKVIITIPTAKGPKA